MRITAAITLSVDEDSMDKEALKIAEGLTTQASNLLFAILKSSGVGRRGVRVTAMVKDDRGARRQRWAILADVRG